VSVIRAFARSGRGTEAIVVVVVELGASVVGVAALFDELDDPDEHAVTQTIAVNVNTARRSTSSKVATSATAVLSPNAPGLRGRSA
jgi:hypothetical protein